VFNFVFSNVVSLIFVVSPAMIASPFFVVPHRTSSDGGFVKAKPGRLDDPVWPPHYFFAARFRRSPIISLYRVSITVSLRPNGP
jgi:hypothetical protein